MDSRQTSADLPGAGLDLDPERPPELRFDHVTTVHHDYHALEDVSVAAPRGQVTVLMGEPGSGKSLLVRHLLDEQGVSSGRVLVDGSSLAEATPAQRERFHRRVGILEGGDAVRESEIAGRSSVVDNLVARLLDAERVPDRSEAERLARSCLEEFDLTQVADHLPHELAGSDQRRLAVATALLPDPALVVLDDPGAGIDVPHLQPMLRAVKGWQGRTGATVVLTTHSIEVARACGDHLIVLRDGRVAREGDCEEMLRGVEKLEDFERRFDTTLSVREADPQRLRRQTRTVDKKSWVLAGLLVLAGVVVICGLLFSGILDLGTGAGFGGQDSHNSYPQNENKPQLGKNGE